MDRRKDFYFDAYDFISGLLEYINRISDELSNVCDSDYDEKFMISRETVNRLKASIEKFIKKWNNDEDGICSSLKTIKEFYAFYCITLNNSSPSMFRRDSKYIIDSLNTSKLALSYKLKKIKGKL